LVSGLAVTVGVLFVSLAVMLLTIPAEADLFLLFLPVGGLLITIGLDNMMMGAKD